MNTAITPIPWKVGTPSSSVGITIWRSDGNDENTGWARICRNVRSAEDAIHIVKACNTHAALEDALRGLLQVCPLSVKVQFTEQFNAARSALEAVALAETEAKAILLKAA